MGLRFEVGASVILLGEDLQFAGQDGDTRVKVLVQAETLRLLAKSAKPLTQQEKFKTYDRHKAGIQAAAVRLYEREPSKGKLIRIRPLDL